MGKYTAIDDPSAHFQVVLYTGDGQTGRTVTNDGNSDLQPDWVVIKERPNSSGHKVYDTSRGAQKLMQWSSTAAEETKSTGLTAFNTDGFTVGSDGGHNQNSQNYVSWQWKMNAGTTSTLSTANSSGTTTDSSVQVNSTAKQSIFTYTGTSTSYARVAHGLGEKADMYIIKPRGTTAGAALNWVVYHKDSASNPERSYAFFTTAAFADNTTYWAAEDNGSAGAITFGGAQQVFYNGTDYVGYAFKSVQGYSKFGSYIGNGNGNGPFIYTGFKPAFIMAKDTAAAGNWFILDHKRNPHNLTDMWFVANGTGAESNYVSAFQVDMVSNGFKLRTSYSEANTNARKYIFMAFAENPFVTSTGIPTTAR
jgi:hypothetical protein